MPVLDGRMRGIRSIREHDFYSGESGAGPSTVCSHQSVVQSTHEGGSMLSINADLKRRALELT
jgi:hypothetical protein